MMREKITYHASRFTSLLVWKRPFPDPPQKISAAPDCMPLSEFLLKYPYTFRSKPNERIDHRQTNSQIWQRETSQ